MTPELKRKVEIFKLKERLAALITEELTEFFPQFNVFDIQYSNGFSIVEHTLGAMVDLMDKGLWEGGRYEALSADCPECGGCDDH